MVLSTLFFFLIKPFNYQYSRTVLQNTLESRFKTPFPEILTLLKCRFCEALAAKRLPSPEKIRTSSAT